MTPPRRRRTSCSCILRYTGTRATRAAPALPPVRRCHLIEPLGFSLDEREVKRAGLDYWEHVDVRVWPAWEAFERELPALGDP